MVYINFRRKRYRVDKGVQTVPEPKPELHQLKVMLSVWWDSKGMIMFELLPPNNTINSAFYCTQLDHLHAQVVINRP